MQTEHPRELDTKQLQEEQNRLIDSIADRFKSVDREYGLIKKEVLELVDSIRESILRRDQQESLIFVSTYINRALKQKGLTENQLIYVSQIIPNQYKVTYKEPGRSLSHLAMIGLKVSEDCLIEESRLDKAFQELANPDLDVLTHEKVKNKYDLMCSLKEKWDRIALAANLPVQDEDDEFNTLDENERTAKAKFANKITLQDGAPTKAEHEGLSKLAHDNWKLIGDMIEIIDKDLNKFAPQSYDHWVQYINAQVSWIVLTKPVTDKKWQRTWLGWIDILRDYKSGGGTFASGRSLVPTGEIDLKTGKPIMRPITKEQIDATYVAKLNHMAFCCKNIPYFFGMFENVKFTQLKNRALRAVRLAPKLEHSA